MIRKRSGAYGVAVYDRTTKSKRWVGTFPTLGEAREAERRESLTPAGRGNETCTDAAERWLIENARPAPASQRTYRYALKRFRQDFKTVRVRDVDKPTARTWARAQPQSNVRVVRALFTDLINDGLHPGPNPFGNLRLEQPRGRKDLIALTESEVARLADAALGCHGDYGPTFRAMILFAAYVGLRPGELFALEPQGHRRRRGPDPSESRRDRSAQSSKERTRAGCDSAPAGKGRARGRGDAH